MNVECFELKIDDDGLRCFDGRNGLAKSGFAIDSISGLSNVPDWLIDYETGEQRAVASDEDVEYLVEKTALKAVSKDNKQITWSFDSGRELNSKFLLQYKTIYIYGHGYLYAVNTETGQKRWEFDAGSNNGSSEITFSDGVVFLAENYKFGNKTSTYLFAADADSGKMKWRDDLLDDNVSDKIQVPGDNLIFSSDMANRNTDNDGPLADTWSSEIPTRSKSICVYDKNTGKPKWKAILNIGDSTYGHFYGPKVGRDGLMFVGTQDTFYAFDSTLKTMNSVAPKKWEKKISYANELVETESHVFLGTDADYAGGGWVYSINKNSGAVEWSKPKSGSLTYSPGITYAAGNLYVSNFEGIVSALDEKTGAVIWSYPHASNEVFGCNTPLAHEGRVFLSCGGSKAGDVIYAFSG